LKWIIFHPHKRQRLQCQNNSVIIMMVLRQHLIPLLGHQQVLQQSQWREIHPKLQ